MFWGIIAKIGNWVANCLPIAVNIAQKAANVVSKTAAVVGALMEGKKIFVESEISGSESKQKTTKVDRPDLFGSSQSKGTSELVEIQLLMDESKKKIIEIKEENSLEHKRIKLQIDIMELIVSSATFERFANNLNIHASNLQIHLQTIQNTAGLLDDVNRQRTAIKATIRTVNHLINVLGVSDKVEKIEGINIEIKPGAISIHNAYKAFESTKILLIDELDMFTSAIKDQLDRVENIRNASRQIPKTGKSVSQWLESSVELRLNDALKTANELKCDLDVIPRLESSLKQEIDMINHTEFA